MPELTTDFTDLTRGVTNLLRDSAYVVVGLGVLGFQKAQVQRVELQSKLANDRALDERLEQLRNAVSTQADNLDKAVENLLHFIESTVEPIEAQLPPTARDAARRAHRQAHEVRSHLHGLVTTTA